MLTMFLIKIVLLVVTLLFVVPAVTGSGVAVRRGGFFRGLLTLLVVGLMNFVLWLAFALVTAGGAVLANYLTFGLIGLLVNALAFRAAAGIMPEVLYVRSFGSAVWASLVMTIASFLISTYL